MLHWRFAPSGQGKLPMSTTNIVITCPLKNNKHYTLLHGTLGANLSLLLLMSLTTLWPEIAELPESVRCRQSLDQMPSLVFRHWAAWRTRAL